MIWIKSKCKLSCTLLSSSGRDRKIQQEAIKKTIDRWGSCATHHLYLLLFENDSSKACLISLNACCFNSRLLLTSSAHCQMGGTKTPREEAKRGIENVLNWEMRRGAIVCQLQYTRRSRRRNKARFLGHLQVNVGIHWNLLKTSGKMMPAETASCSFSSETAD